MKCLVPRCRDAAVDSHSVSIPLCTVHGRRYRKAYGRRWNGASHFGEEARFASWAATWLQQVDEEMLNELTLPPEPRKSSYAQYVALATPLPEHATKTGQITIAKRDKENAALEAQLKGDIAEYARGRRMELEHELKMKRIEAEREARQKLHGESEHLMGTNYYLMHPEKRCEHCGNTNPHEKSFEHIGKSSVGWHFSFNGMEHKTADEWKRHIEMTIAAGGWISTEYDREHDWNRISPGTFWDLVLVKRTSPECQAKYSTNYHKTVCVDGVDFNDHTFS